MTPLDTVRDRYHSDAGTAQRSTLVKLEFVNANLTALAKSSKPKVAEDAKALLTMHKATKRFTPKQMDYIENMYELTMKGLGLPSVGRHVDRKRKGLRYG